MECFSPLNTVPSNVISLLLPLLYNHQTLIREFENYVSTPNAIYFLWEYIRWPHCNKEADSKLKITLPNMRNVYTVKQQPQAVRAGLLFLLANSISLTCKTPENIRNTPLLYIFVPIPLV